MRRFEMMNGFLVLFCKSTITRPQHNIMNGHENSDFFSDFTYFSRTLTFAVDSDMLSENL